MTRKLTPDELDSQAWQFLLLADSLERQWADNGDADHANRRKARVFVVLRHVSRSGMRRVIDFKVMTADNDVVSLTLVGADVYRYDYDRQGYIVDGAGMDMGFALVDSIMWQVRAWAAGRVGRRSLLAKLANWQDNVRVDWL